MYILQITIFLCFSAIIDGDVKFVSTWNESSQTGADWLIEMVSQFVPSIQLTDLFIFTSVYDLHMVTVNNRAVNFVSRSIFRAIPDV